MQVADALEGRLRNACVKDSSNRGNGGKQAQHLRYSVY